MALINFRCAPEPEIDDTIAIKADDGNERVVAFVTRAALDDYFPERSLTSQQRVTLLESNLDALQNVIAAKYERGEWRPESRLLATIRRIDLTFGDLRSGPRLSDVLLHIEEKARYQQRPG